MQANVKSARPPGAWDRGALSALELGAWRGMP